MRLLRFEDAGKTQLGVLRGEDIMSLETLSGEYPTMMSVIVGGDTALARIAALKSGRTVKLQGARLLAPVERPGKYLAIGMNYHKHAAEAERAGVAVPKQQLWFNKQTTCISGPFDPIEPGPTERLDYEVELGFVIGKPAKNVSEERAREHVFGYFVADDVSARDWQFHSPTFTMGKSFDTHGPIGPWIVTADEVPDPHALALRCFVNGELRQQSDTGEMIYNVWQQIAYLSAAFTLEPGDLIAAGTPEGVGAASNPPRFLQRGDVVRCEIDGIGTIENTVAQPHA